jgi:hypothetical protein
MLINALYADLKKPLDEGVKNYLQGQGADAKLQ